MGYVPVARDMVRVAGTLLTFPYRSGRVVGTSESSRSGAGQLNPDGEGDIGDLVVCDAA